MMIIRRLGIFVAMVVLQVFLLNEIAFSGYLNPYVYISFLLFLPPQLSRMQHSLLGFALGVAVGLFENTPGLHAAAATALGYLRLSLLGIFAERQEMVEEDFKVTDLRSIGFLLYLLLGIMLFHLVLFSLENFSFQNFDAVLWRSIYSSVFTFVFIVLFHYLFRPRSSNRYT